MWLGMDSMSGVTLTFGIVSVLAIVVKTLYEVQGANYTGAAQEALLDLALVFVAGYVIQQLMVSGLKGMGVIVAVVAGGYQLVKVSSLVNLMS